jgi:hypothetical protein
MFKFKECFSADESMIASIFLVIPTALCDCCNVLLESPILKSLVCNNSYCTYRRYYNMVFWSLLANTRENLKRVATDFVII